MKNVHCCKWANQSDSGGLSRGLVLRRASYDLRSDPKKLTTKQLNHLWDDAKLPVAWVLQTSASVRRREFRRDQEGRSRNSNQRSLFDLRTRCIPSPDRSSSKR